VKRKALRFRRYVLRIVPVISILRVDTPKSESYVHRAWFGVQAGPDERIPDKG